MRKNFERVYVLGDSIGLIGIRGCNEAVGLDRRVRVAGVWGITCRAGGGTVVDPAPLPSPPPAVPRAVTRGDSTHISLAINFIPITTVSSSVTSITVLGQTFTQVQLFYESFSVYLGMYAGLKLT